VSEILEESAGDCTYRLDFPLLLQPTQPFPYFANARWKFDGVVNELPDRGEEIALEVWRMELARAEY
jgi:hypothetical protein